jgi:hypothetical protein
MNRLFPASARGDRQKPLGGSHVGGDVKQAVEPGDAQHLPDILPRSYQNTAFFGLLEVTRNLQQETDSGAVHESEIFQIEKAVSPADAQQECLRVDTPYLCGIQNAEESENNAEAVGDLYRIKGRLFRRFTDLLQGRFDVVENPVREEV